VRAGLGFKVAFYASFGVVVTSSVGTGPSILAKVGSAVLDLPTGATVVCAFGLSLLAGPGRA